MESKDPICLIDWNSPAVEFNCEPLIPLPNIKRHVQVNDDNPFDAVERKINENALFEMIMDPSTYRMENCSKTSFNNLLVLNEPNTMLTPVKTTSSSNNSMELSPISPNISEIRNRLSDLKKKWSLLESDTSNNFSNSFFPQCIDAKTEALTQSIDNFLNDGFVERNLQDSNIRDSLISRMKSESQEDLNAIVPQWDEMALLSSSDDESEDLSPKIFSCLESEDRMNKTKTNICTITTKNKSCPAVNLSVNSQKGVEMTKKPLKGVLPLENAIKKNEIKKPDTIIIKKKCINSSTNTRRSAPIATSTPTIRQNLKNNSNRKEKKTELKNLIYSCPSSPDSTSSQRSTPRTRNKIFNLKACSRKLTLNTVSSTNRTACVKTSGKVLPITKFVQKSTATGVKLNVKHKENIPFKC